MTGAGFVCAGINTLKTTRPVSEFDLSIATHTAQTSAIADWEKNIPRPVNIKTSTRRTALWWDQFWNRSWISVQENTAAYLPSSSRPLQLGLDSKGGSQFAGEITNALAVNRVLSDDAIAILAQQKPDGQSNQLADISLHTGFTLAAWIKPAPGETGRIFDKITAFGTDGFMLDTYPGLSLRLNVGGKFLSETDCLKAGEWQHVAATVDAQGNQRIYLNGKLLKENVVTNPGTSRVTQAYALQRWLTACAGRGNYPVKFNGSIFTVVAEHAVPLLSHDARRGFRRITPVIPRLRERPPAQQRPRETVLQRGRRLFPRDHDHLRRLRKCGLRLGARSSSGQRNSQPLVALCLATGTGTHRLNARLL
jgi:hypothetical protein